MNTFKLSRLWLITILAGCHQNEQVSGVFDYQITNTETITTLPNTYVSACLVSNAPDAESRKNTLIAATKKIHDQHNVEYYFITMANHESFCQHESRLTAIGLYSVNNTGWFGNNLYTHTNETYEWKILTTNHTNTTAQIEYTQRYLKIYEKNKAHFIEQHGLSNYYQPLSQFVEQQIPQQPQFVTSGAWVDDYYMK